MNRPTHSRHTLPIELVRRIDQLCDQFESQWQPERVELIADFLLQVPSEQQPFLFGELLRLEVALKLDHGLAADAIDYISRFPQFAAAIRQCCVASGGRGVASDEELAGKLEVVANPEKDVGCEIGRYQVERLIGHGGQGRVYVARDPLLNRQVALKQPLSFAFETEEQRNAFLTEARTLASLDHLHIVPVFDCGVDPDGVPFVVSKLIDGDSLGHLLKDGRFEIMDAVELAANIADALHYAHRQKMVHRDVKPGNILIDQAGLAYLTDFGLVLTDDGYGVSGSFAGTPAYMSPEQARGEGHLVDGRSDVFSLGVVLYEMLTGERPFVGANWLDVIDRIVRLPVRPPRQLNDRIPRELERIVLRALEKNVQDRYLTAADMADELRMLLAENASSTLHLSTLRPTADRRNAIVPPGLRSFSFQDADFFLPLLSGPRDGHGIPDSVRFWKSRIDSQQRDFAFRTSLIYGPSGCGKSSFVKAGLIPRLANHVLPVFLEASANGTESQLAEQLARLTHGDPVDYTANLSSLVATLRRQMADTKQKCVIFLDQFEQWLFGHDWDADTILSDSLRQCDGVHVQCVLLVRDDFWSDVSRFAKQLDVKFVENQNSRMLDLLDVRHAQQVLAWFGQAWGCIPDHDAELTSEQREFIRLAVQSIATQNRIVCVRLALFAEMIRGEAWHPKTIEQIGGTEGVGMQFLDSLFCNTHAPYEHRLHADAAERVLAQLVPNEEVEIKRPSVSEAALQVASGYADRPAQFEDLIRILDQETRLITPVAALRLENDSPTGGKSDRRFQLTHDYLVPSLRTWIDRNQRSTPAGQARLLLRDRTKQWQQRRDARLLPSFGEFARIRRWTKKADWSAAQADLMRQARLRLGVRFLGAIGVAALIVTTLTIVMIHRQRNARLQAESVVHSDWDSLPNTIGQLDLGNRRIDAELRRVMVEGDRDERLRASLALLPSDAGQAEFLFQQCFEISPQELGVVRTVLGDSLQQRVPELKAILRDTTQTADRRFRAGVLLAADGTNANHANEDDLAANAEFLAVRLINECERNPQQVPDWLALWQPAERILADELFQLATDESVTSAERQWATVATCQFATARPELLVNLLTQCDLPSFELCFQAVKNSDAAKKSVVQQFGDDLPFQQANRLVCAALRIEDSDAVWQRFSGNQQNDLRTEFTLTCRECGIELPVLANRLAMETDQDRIGMLLNAMGRFECPDDDVVRRVRQRFLSAPDAGYRAMAEWLLRSWNRWNVTENSAISANADDQRNWFVTPSGFTMVVLGPATVEMGSPEDEVERLPREVHYQSEIDYRFAIADRETSVSQFETFLKQRYGNSFHDRYANFAPTDDCARTHVSWYLAAEYCDWLSEQENIAQDQWCYAPNSDNRYADGMQMMNDVGRRTGYRLPTEVEWEYAARANSINSRFFGRDAQQLPHFAWYAVNANGRCWPGAQRRPNSFGMFDMLGNLWEWCHDPMTDHPERFASSADIPATATVLDSQDRISKGGSFATPALYLRTAVRNPDPPTKFNANYGFRIARTVID